MTAVAAAVSRRERTGADAPLSRRLFAESRGDLLLLPSDVRDVLCEMQLRARQIARETEHPAASHEILVRDGEPVGEIVVDRIGGALHLVDLAVLEDRRRQGIASAALTELADEADRAGLPVHLSVWPANVGARRLYESFGFTATGTAGAYLTMTRHPHGAPA